MTQTLDYQEQTTEIIQSQEQIKYKNILSQFYSRSTHKLQKHTQESIIAKHDIKILRAQMCERKALKDSVIVFFYRKVSI